MMHVAFKRTRYCKIALSVQIIVLLWFLVFCVSWSSVFLVMCYLGVSVLCPSASLRTYPVLAWLALPCSQCFARPIGSLCALFCVRFPMSWFSSVCISAHVFSSVSLDPLFSFHGACEFNEELQS